MENRDDFDNKSKNIKIEKRWNPWGSIHVI